MATCRPADAKALSDSVLMSKRNSPIRSSVQGKRPAVGRCLPLVLALSAVLASSNADAATETGAPLAPLQTAAPESSQAGAADAAFEAARQAFRTQDEDRLRALLPTLASSPLHAYGDYWLAVLALRANPQDDAPVQTFLAQNAGTVLADRLRGEWLLALGKRADFSRFREQRKAWVSNGNDTQIGCYDMLSKYLLDAPERHADIALEARRMLAASSDPGSEACAALADKLLDDKAMPLLPYLQALVERSQATPAERVAQQRHGSIWARQLKRALAKPEPWLKKHDTHVRASDEAERQIAYLAMVEQAHDDPERAATHALVWESALSATDKAGLWGRIARSAQHHLLPQAHDWFARGGSLVGVGPDYVHAVDTLEARIRADLRRGSTRAATQAGISSEPDWADVHATILALPPAVQAQDNWSYWNAQALAAQGQIDASQPILDNLAGHFTYYGRLAAEQLLRPTVLPPAPIAPETVQVDSFAQRPAVLRAKMLYDAGLADDGRREWAWELRTLDDNGLRTAAAVAQRFGLLDRAIFASEHTRNVIDIPQRFPTPHLEMLLSVCSPLGIEAAWVYGLIRQESRFMQQVRSGVGAIGLMQIMPATAKYVAKHIGLQGFRREDIAQVPINLRLGSEYLRMVYDDQDGRTLLASAAYNAGPNRVRRWRAALARPLDGRIFVETIPIDETRDYVQKVLFNTTVYAALMQKPGSALLPSLAPISPKDPPERSDLP